MTVLRGLNGDRSIVPNGQITGVRRSDRGYRTDNVELLARDSEAVEAAVQAGSRYAPEG